MSGSSSKFDRGPSRFDPGHGARRELYQARGWSYELAGLEPQASDQGAVTVYRRPTWLRRSLGATDERRTYFRSGGEWRDEKGGSVTGPVAEILEAFWSEHGRDATTADEASRDAVQIASEDSFPASDPPAWTHTCA